MPEIYKPAPRRAILGGALLHLLSLPLLPVIVLAVLAGDPVRLLASISAFALINGGATLIRYGLAAAAKPRRTAGWPHKIIGAVMTAAGTVVTSALLLHHSPLFSALAGALAFAGCWLHYGLERPRPAMDGASAELVKLMDEAEERIRVIEESARAIRNTELAGRLRAIAAKARDVLGVIEEDPRDARRARKFLRVYLEGARKVAQGYARVHPQTESAELEENFRNVLITIEDVVGQQHQKLLENDALDLDVQIEVLTARLKREGVI